MTIASWIAEFLPVPADNWQVQQNDESRIEHSLRKWRGLSPENLQKHNIVLHDGRLFERDGTEIPDFRPMGGSTCALCEAHYDTEGDDGGEDYVTTCFTCPLRAVGFACETSGSAWWDARESNRPDRMIEALEEAFIYNRRKNRKKENV